MFIFHWVVVLITINLSMNNWIKRTEWNDGLFSFFLLCEWRPKSKSTTHSIDFFFFYIFIIQTKYHFLLDFVLVSITILFIFYEFFCLCFSFVHFFLFPLIALKGESRRRKETMKKENQKKTVLIVMAVSIGMKNRFFIHSK